MSSQYVPSTAGRGLVTWEKVMWEKSGKRGRWPEQNFPTHNLLSSPPGLTTRYIEFAWRGVRDKRSIYIVPLSSLVQEIVRTSDIRVSERVPLNSLRLKPFGPIYNELTGEVTMTIL